MNCGGGVGGYIASRDDERYVRQYNASGQHHRHGAAGEHGFYLSSSHQTSYGMRERAATGPATRSISGDRQRGLHVAARAAGFREVGETILRQARYAAVSLSRIAGVRLPIPQGFFKEFAVNFDGTGRSVAEINERLLEYRIFGGKDISREFPELAKARSTA